jgi:proteic killer suppression protein
LRETTEHRTAATASPSLEDFDKRKFTFDSDLSMIEIIKHNGLKLLYHQDDRSKLAPDMVERIAVIVAALDAAATSEAMEKAELPAAPAQGRLEGLWAATVRANWRIVFRFNDGRASDVDFVDYH